jgi:hypothetical protein
LFVNILLFYFCKYHFLVPRYTFSSAILLSLPSISLDRISLVRNPYTAIRLPVTLCAIHRFRPGKHHDQHHSEVAADDERLGTLITNTAAPVLTSYRTQPWTLRFFRNLTSNGTRPFFLRELPTLHHILTCVLWKFSGQPLFLANSGKIAR